MVKYLVVEFHRIKLFGQAEDEGKAKKTKMITKAKIGQGKEVAVAGAR